MKSDEIISRDDQYEVAKARADLNVRRKLIAAKLVPIIERALAERRERPNAPGGSAR